ncbi:MAG: hypothetical protein B7Z73_07850 [Planctomycetia bacterium 21-64-5]|nr:MAG: hypothetical protein B7Z73_07850 [Planctomycetia bacterium 21-64-5]
MVADTPGVTRDRKEAEAVLAGTKVLLVDTAGLEEAAPDTLPGRMRASTGAAIDDIMGLMTERRIRHLPVLVDDKLVGIISIGDVVKAHHDEVTMENHYLKSYIQS